MSRFDVLLRTTGRRLEREGFSVYAPTREVARGIAAFILGVPVDLVVLAANAADVAGVLGYRLGVSRGNVVVAKGGAA